MNKRILTSLMAGVGILMLTSMAFATEPEYCDPQQDPDECGCPSGVTCSQTDFSELTRVSDPGDVNAAANISATWNSTEQRWRVTIDATAMPGYGILVIDEDSGEFDSLDDLFEYLSVLIDQELEPEFDANGVAKFPPMHIVQKGITHRYNESTNQWAEGNSNSLIFDAITNDEGVLHIGEENASLFDLTQLCGGDDQYAYDQESNNDMSAQQCSEVDVGIYVNMQHDDCVERGLPACQFEVKRASTHIETLGTTYLRPTLKCTLLDYGGGLIGCDPDEVFVHVRLRADELDVDNYYFTIGSFYDDDQALSPVTNEVELLRSMTGPDGVCGLGYGEKNTDFVIPWTREGSYNSSHQSCEPQ